MRQDLFLAAALTLMGCSAGRTAKWSALPEYQGQVAKPAEGSAEALVAQGDEAWKKRGELKGLEAAIVAWEKAVSLQPEDAATLAKLSRAYYFLSDAYLRNADKKDYLATFERGVAAAERSLAAGNPRFKAEMVAGKRLEQAIPLVGAEGVEAMYWYASNLGKWSRAKGFSVVLGNKDKIRAVMDRVLALDPQFFHGAADRYFGVFYAVAPGFAGGDMEKSRQHFEKSLQTAPNYVGTKVLMADTWATKKDDRAKFEALLKEVIAAPVDIIPGIEAETRNEQVKAKELLDKANELF